MVVKKLKYCVNNEWKESMSGRYSPVMNPSSAAQVTASFPSVNSGVVSDCSM